MEYTIGAGRRSLRKRWLRFVKIRKALERLRVPSGVSRQTAAIVLWNTEYGLPGTCHQRLTQTRPTVAARLEAHRSDGWSPMAEQCQDRCR